MKVFSSTGRTAVSPHQPSTWPVVLPFRYTQVTLALINCLYLCGTSGTCLPPYHRTPTAAVQAQQTVVLLHTQCPVHDTRHLGMLVHVTRGGVSMFHRNQRISPQYSVPGIHYYYCLYVRVLYPSTRVISHNRVRGRGRYWYNDRDLPIVLCIGRVSIETTTVLIDCNRECQSPTPRTSK